MGGLNIDGDIFYSYSVCNWFGCNCEKCEAGTAYDEWDKTCQNPWELLPGCVEQVDGACPTGACCDYGTWKPERALEKCCVRWDEDDGGRTVDQQEFCVDTRRMMEEEEEKKEDDGCADFNYVRSLSAAGKRKLLAEKYCTGADQRVRGDIFEVLLSLTLSKYKNVDFSKAKEYIQKAGGINQVLTCDLFNKSYGETDHLKLCEDKPQVPKKGKKQKKRNEYEYETCGTEPVTKKRNETKAKRTEPVTKKRNETKRNEMKETKRIRIRNVWDGTGH